MHYKLCDKNRYGEDYQCTKMKNEYLPRFAKILDVFKETPDTKTFRVNIKGMRMGYQPGQFVECSVLDLGEAPISICSFSKDYMDLCVRNVGNVTRSLFNLKKGDMMSIRGPYGSGYPMHFMEGNDVIVVAGGTGVAPVKGVLEFIEANRKRYGDVHVFLGFRSPSDMLFKREIKRWEKIGNVHITVDKADDKWRRDVGVVTKLLSDSGMDNHNKIVVSCGPPIMIKFVIKTLEKMDFNHDQIYVSLERMMQCGVQKCGHCMIGGKYVCKDGPVLNYEVAKWLKD